MDVSLPGVEVGAVSALAQQGGARVTWAVDGSAAVVLRLVPATEGLEAVVVSSASSPATVSGLVPLELYTVRFENDLGEPVGPECAVRPLDFGALDSFPMWTATSGQASSGFGATVTFAGDLDGDGAPELVVGAPNATAGEDFEGAVFVYAGAALGAPPQRIEIDIPYSTFGAHVAPAGDVNGDGLDDLVASAPNPFATDELLPSPAGVLHVFLGTTAGTITGASFTGIDGDLYGTAVAGRDLDGDGLSELWVGGSGQSWANLLSDTYADYSVTAASMTRLGFVVAAADVDGDADVDLLVSEPLYGSSGGGPRFGPSSGAPFRAGGIQVHYQSGSGFAVAPLVGTTAGQLLGTAMIATDLDGDGAAELVASSTGCALPGSADPLLGAVSVWRGRAAGFLAAPDQILTTGAICFGFAIAVGDVDGDGALDLVAGDPNAGADSNGELRVFRGDGAGGFETASTTIEGAAAARLGRSVSVGDLDGDGRLEVLAGAPGEAEALGAAYLFRSAPRFGPSVNLAGSVNGDTFEPEGSSFTAQEGREVLYSCTWLWGDGTETALPCIPGAFSAPPTHAFTPGTWDVTLRVESSDGNTGEAALRITVSG